MSPPRVVLCFIGIISLALGTLAIQTGIGRGYQFYYQTYEVDDNGYRFFPGLLGEVDVTTPYLGGDPGCCKICQDTPHIEKGKTEFFNFEWVEWTEWNGPNTCNCMNGLEKETYAFRFVTGYCGNNASFLNQIDGSLGEDRLFDSGSLHVFGDVGDEEDPENVEDCCVKCQKMYAGVELVDFEMYKNVGSCYCYKSVPGIRPQTFGQGYYAGLCS